MELADRVTSTLIQCRWTGLKYHGLCCNCSWKNTFSQNIHSLGSIRAFLFPTTSIRPPWARINSQSRRSSSSHHSRVRRLGLSVFCRDRAATLTTMLCLTPHQEVEADAKI